MQNTNILVFILLDKSSPNKYQNTNCKTELQLEERILIAIQIRPPQESWLLALDSMGYLLPNCVTSTSEIAVLHAQALLIYMNSVDHLLNIQFRSDRYISEGRFAYSPILSN